MSKVKIFFKKCWRRGCREIDGVFYRVLQKVPAGGVLYYSFVNPSFRREMQAVLAGKEEYAKNLRIPAAGNNLLRRNIHRLEKGLSMKELREVFAIDYVSETVAAFLDYREGVSERDKDAPGEYQWFRDVLGAYFKVTTDHPKTSDARIHFFDALSEEICGDSHPYHRDLDTPLGCRYEDILQLAIRRRSVRWFLDKPVPRDLVEKAMEVGLYSASACNRQPFSLRIFDDPVEIAEIAKIPMGTSGYDHQIPCLAVVMGHLDAYFSERDRHLIYIDSSLAVTPFMMACETLGLATCAINWPDMEDREKAMDKRLDLAKWERPIMLIAIGYADPEIVVPRSVKKTIATMIKWQPKEK